MDKRGKAHQDWSQSCKPCPLTMTFYSQLSQAFSYSGTIFNRPPDGTLLLRRLYNTPKRPKLLTNELRQRLPKLYATEGVDDPVAQVKFFTPDSNWSWYPVEFDDEDLLFGLVIGFERELAILGCPN